MRYVCVLSYDGSSYAGYQKQKHDSNTIQENVEKVLSVIFKEKVTIYGSGRTDKGVHAMAQVFHFDSALTIPVANVKKAANEMLPLDIRINSCKIAKNDFHARYSSHHKMYVYKIKCKDEISAFDSRYYAYEKDTIDVDLLQKAANLFVGEHDFKNFTTNKVEEVESFVKTIYSVLVTKKKNIIEIEFNGSGFLRYQVRMMVGALLVVATNKKDISFISDRLKENSDNKCSYKAPPQGLYLKKVVY